MKIFKKKVSKLLLMAGLATALTGYGVNTETVATPTPKTEENIEKQKKLK